MQLLPARKPAPTAARFAPLLFALCAGAAAQQPQEPVTIDAESIEGISGLEVTARGGVEFRQDATSVYADYLKFNREFGRLEAEGGVRLVQEGDTKIRSSQKQKQFKARDYFKYTLLLSTAVNTSQKMVK